MDSNTRTPTSQELSERFDLLATGATGLAVFIVDLAGEVICWNIGAEQLLGYRADELVGKNFALLFSPEDVITGRPQHEMRTALAQARAESDCWLVRKGGARFWCRVALTPLLNELKQARSFAVVLLDLSEGEATLAQRKRADGLAEANRSKEDFMAVLAHELRSPLSPIRNAVNVLRQIETNDPIIEQAGNIIDRQVGLMVRLVDDLLDISRITQGKLRLLKEQLDLRLVLNHAAEAARPFMISRKHDFSVALPTQPIWVFADATRLEQVIVNLLNNAAKYSNENSLIRMSISTEAGEAVIRVRDNGDGIAPELLPYIFDLFAQVDGTLGRSYGGLGIGLALSQNLVAMHEGRLQASSAGVGQGCEFTIKLPILVEPQVPVAKTALSPNLKLGRTLQVLVVEDNIDAADSMSMLLRLYGHEVQIARTGPSALELASVMRPDLVLLDIGLPGMNGYRVAEKLRLMPELSGMTICALTGHTPSDADRQRQLQTGFDRYYVKPIEPAKLLELFKLVVPLNRGNPNSTTPPAP